MIPALKEKPESDGEETRQPKVAVATGLAENDQRTLIAILEGEIGTNTDSFRIGNIEPQGLGLYTFDPNSQSLERISYQDLRAAVDINGDSTRREVADLRRLLYHGPNLDIIINSTGGHTDVGDLFDNVAKQIAIQGGKVSSYATAKAWSLGAGLWADAKERYVLPFSVTCWHTPRFGEEDSRQYRKTMEEAERELREEDFTPLQRELIHLRLKEAQTIYDKTVSEFRRVIANVPDKDLRERLMRKFHLGEEVFIFGPQLVEWGLATLCQDIESMKKAFYKSIGAEPYCAELGPIQEFWNRAEADYETIKDRLSKERKEGAREKTRADIPPTKKEEAPYQQPEAQGNIYVRKSPQRRSRHVVSTVSYAAVIALMVGTGYMTMRYVNSWRERNDRVMQPLVENLCSKYDWVSIHTGPQKVDWKRENGTVVEAEVGRNLYGTKLVSIPSMGYNSECR